MKIAHVTATFPPYQAGTGNVCYHNARQLALRGHDVHVFTAALPGAPAREALDGVHVHRLRPLLQIGNAPLLPQLLWRLRNFDLIHLHYPFILGAEFTRVAAAVSRTSLLITIHNDLIGDGLRARLFAAYQRFSAWFTVRHAATLCAVSLDHYRHTRLRRALQDHEPPVVEVPNGVDVDHFRPEGPAAIRTSYGIPAEAKLLLFVAALDRAHHFKGLPYLLEALSRLPQDVWLVVIGDGDLRSRYEQQAVALGIASRTVFAGAVPNLDTPPYYRDADLTVLPTSPPESFGVVLIESMACGTPVIASDIPGVRTIVESGRCGRLIPAGDVDVLSTTIEELLHHLQVDPMRLTARKTAQMRYAWSKIGGGVEEIYADVVVSPVAGTRHRSCTSQEKPM